LGSEAANSDALKESNVDVKRHLARLQKKLSRDFGEWVVFPTAREMFWEDPAAVYRAYLNGEDVFKRIASRTDKLLTWHFSHYTHAVLNEGRHAWDDFALAARYAKAAVQFESAFAEAGKRGSILLDQAPFNFSLNMLAGWRADADTVGRLLVRGLDTSLLDFRHNDRHHAGKVYRHLWFVLHLYSAAKGITLDTSLYSYPDDMSPYAAVLANWRTLDPAVVQGFVTAMAEFHVQEARQTAHDEVAEFDDPDYMLFPHEILSYLRLREWMGLPNPQHFDHPLMNQPLAVMPSEPLPQPETPLLDRVIEKFRQDYPGSFA
jgi:hypothetical protein